MTSAGDPIEVAIRVSAMLERLGIDHTIGGSIAASFAGEPRSTIDIDVVAAVTMSHTVPLLAALEGRYYVGEDSLKRAVETRGTFNLIDEETTIKVDVFVAGGTPLDHQQLARRKPVEVRPGQVIHVHPPEDILLQKLRWYRAGGQVSDRQWRDILGIVRTQGSRLDRAYLEQYAPVIGVEHLLARALDGPDY